MVCDENGSLGYMYMVISTLRLNYGSPRYGYIHFETEEWIAEIWLYTL